MNSNTFLKMFGLNPDDFEPSKEGLNYLFLILLRCLIKHIHLFLEEIFLTFYALMNFIY